MSEINQRVLNLNKIDSKEDAYIAGFQTHVWWKDHYWSNLQKDYLEKNQLLLVCPFLHPFHKSWLKLICENFKIISNEIYYRQSVINGWLNRGIKFEDIYRNERYECACAEHRVRVEISEESKIHIGNKFPICKEEFKPYEYLGFYHASAHNLLTGEISFINSKAALKTFKKQLIQWYGFNDEKYFKTDIMQIKDSPLYFMVFSAKGAKKFLKILPKDIFLKKRAYKK